MVKGGYRLVSTITTPPRQVITSATKTPCSLRSLSGEMDLKLHPRVFKGQLQIIILE